MRGGCQHIVEVVSEHPVLFRAQREIFQTRHDLVLAAEIGDVHGVAEVVVSLISRAGIRMLRRVRRELTADELEVVGVVAV